MGGLVLKNRIILARPRDTDLRNLEVALDLSHKKSAEERFHIQTSNNIQFHNYLDILILCSNEMTRGEKEILRANHKHPVIMLSEQPQPDLISQFNIYRSTKSMDLDIAPLIEEAIAAKELIINTLGNRTDIFFNLEIAIKKELEKAQEQQRIISSFEALHDILARDSSTILVQARRDPREVIMEHLHAKVIPYLDLFEKNGDPAHLSTAKTNFLPSLHELAKLEEARRLGDRDKLVQFLVGGSTISEQGMRCLININPQKKYDVSQGVHGYFLRDVHDRKGMSHSQIAQIRYDTQQTLTEIFTKNGNGAAEVGKFARIYHPLSYENITYLVQEALIGPDLEYVLLKIKDAIPKAATNHQKGLLKKVRAAIIEKYLDDLAGWQKHTQKMTDTDAKRMENRPDVVARYFKGNLTKIPAEYCKKGLTELSEAELSLWDTCLKYLNPKLLGISRGRVVLSQDASSKNAILHIGRKFPSMDELLEAITESNEQGRKKAPIRDKLDDIFYHVDTGFVVTHFLEDFFHIVDAYESADTDLKDHQILKHRQKWYDHFCQKKGINQEPVVLNLAGAYRNMRRAFLVIKEFQEKNATFAREDQISENTYNIFRRSYEHMNAHHMKRATLYLSELKNQFNELIGKTKNPIEEVQTKYKEVTSNKEPIDDVSAKDAKEFITGLQQQIMDESTSRRNKKYLSTILHGTMGYCMAHMVKKMIDIKLPSYSEAKGDDSNE